MPEADRYDDVLVLAGDTCSLAMMNPEDVSLEQTPTYFTIWHWLLFYPATD
jgi:hypothetical protein